MVSEQVGLSGQFVVVVVVVRRFCVLSWLCVANCLFAEMALNQVGEKLLLLRDGLFHMIRVRSGSVM